MIRRNGVPISRVNLVQRHEKQNYAKDSKPSILIDDYEKNTKEFSMKGDCITFQNAGQVISELKKSLIDIGYK